MSRSSYSAPAFARYRVLLAAQGYVVVDPEDRRIGAPTPFRLQAEGQMRRLQAEADRTARRGERSCLGCARTFVSAGIHNRLCKSCRLRDPGEAPQRPYVSSGRRPTA